MRKKRIKLLANRIEQLEWGSDAGDFNMARTTHVCDSPACIAGWAVYLFGDPEDLASNGRAIMREAADLLDIDHHHGGSELFCPQAAGVYLDSEPGEEGHISPEQAARTLRHLAETGEVNWQV